MSIKVQDSIYKIEKIIDAKHKILYLVNPKVASRSLINSMVWDKNSQGFEAEIYKENLNDLAKNFNFFKDYYIFSLIRHPLDRVISCYKDKILDPKPDDEKWIIKPRLNDGLNKNITFDEFIEFLISEKGSDKLADRHWISQSVIFNLYGPQYYPKKIWILNQLNETMKFLFQKINRKHVPIVHFNKTISIEINITNDIKKKIKKRYEEDFELYKELERSS